MTTAQLPFESVLGKRYLADPDGLIKLSEQASDPEAPIGELADRFSVILHDLRMSGAWKRTNRGRLRQTEEMLCTHISPQCRQDLRFLDVGASDGITTVEAARKLRHHFGQDVEAYAADINIWLLRYRCGPIVEYRAKDGEPIMVRIGPIGVRLAQSRRTAAQPDANRLAQLYLQCRRLRAAMRLDTRISLVNPLSRLEPGLTAIEFDCLRRDEELVGRISAIRASNTLNLGYFGPQQIEKAVGHFHAYLRDGGCLVVSRNVDGPAGETESGSVWIREPDRFRWVADFGSGSEVKALVGGRPS